MKPSPSRQPRTIPQVKDPDKETEDFNNAFYLLREMTSARRLSTLARRPTPQELLWAIDTYISGDPFEHSRERARELREVALSWREGEEVPQAVHEAAQRFFLSIGGKEPAGGWESDDGYRKRKLDEEQEPTSEPNEEQEPTSIREASKKAAEMAQAFANLLNLTGALAAPQVWARASPRPTRAHLVEHVDGVLSLLAGTSGQDLLTAHAKRLRAQLATWEPGPQLPPELQRAARELLAAVGVNEPPGGWEAFDGTGD